MTSKKLTRQQKIILTIALLATPLMACFGNNCVGVGDAMGIAGKVSNPQASCSQPVEIPQYTPETNEVKVIRLD